MKYSDIHERLEAMLDDADKPVSGEVGDMIVQLQNDIRASMPDYEELRLWMEAFSNENGFPIPSAHGHAIIERITIEGELKGD